MQKGTRSLLWSMLRLAKDVYKYITFGHGQFRGVYENFAQAQAAVPPKKKIGYNHAALARAYQAELQLKLDCSDYPALFHLVRSIKEHSTILDIGGNIGVHYLRYRKYVSFKEIKWIVWDVPEITKAGRETCAGIPNIQFVNDVAELNESRIDILFGYDSFQYFAPPTLFLKELLDKGIRPTHILIDGLPLYDGEQFVTLQNGGLVRYPQYVFNRADLVAGVADFGYELVDSWLDHRSACIIPFHRDRAVRGYTGFHFSRKAEMSRLGANDSVSINVMRERP